MVLALLGGAAIGAFAVWALCRPQIARLQADLEHERRAASNLPDTFKAFASETMLASLQQLETHARSQDDQRRTALEALVRPIKEALEKVDAQSRRIENERKQSYGAISTQMQQIAENEARLVAETGNLVTALRAPAARGRWGEMQLRRVAEMAGMLPHCDFFEQTSVSVDDRRLRPDMIVKLAGGLNVVVDAKVPLEAYLRAIEATDEDAKAAHMADHVRQIRQHVQKLRSKGYREQFQPSPEFVVLFIPGESFYSAALQQDPTLLEDGFGDVVIASPTSLIGLLRGVAYGWHQETVAESAREVSTLGREVYQRLATMGEHITKLGSRLDGAVGAYNEMVGSLDRRVFPAARKLAEHGAGGAKEMGALDPVDRTTQRPQAPELDEAETVHELPRALDAA
jgi:DNA recombination protein RmuC